MPYRDLLYNRVQGGAPKRDPNSQAMSLESARFFSLDELATYRDNQWPDQQNTNNLTGMGQNRSPKHLQTPSYNSFDQPNLSYQPHYVQYQTRGTEVDPRSQHYSPDVMDTDVSSISYSSISSTPCADMVPEEDAQSSYFTSRKASVNSSLVSSEPSPIEPYLAYNTHHEMKTPYDPQVISSQCSDTRAAPPAEKYNDFLLRSSPAAMYNSHTFNLSMPDFSDQGRRQSQPASVSKSRKSTAKGAQISELHNEKIHNRNNSFSSKDGKSGPKDDVKQAKKVRAARQAHSLVERKYRENLNARIVDLHKMLKSAHQRKMSSAEEDTEDREFEEDGEKTMKFKKSDVLVEAISYVQSTELERRQKDEEIEQLREKIRIMENWIRHGNIGQG